MKIFFTLFLALILSQIMFGQTKFDEYDRLNLIDDDESARLNNFANELRKNPTANGFVIIYKPENWKTGKFLRHFYGVKRVLTDFENIKPERLHFVAGSQKQEMQTEFWLIFDGEKFPDYKTISLEDELKENITKRTLFDYECIDCSPAVIIDYFIFREGLNYLAEALKANPTANVLIKIGKGEYLLKTVKERRILTNEIIARLKKNQIQRNRISIQFTSGMDAFFYIIPKANKK